MAYPEPHTFKHFRKEAWFFTIMNRSYIQNWTDKGKPTINDRIREKINTIMDTHKPIPLGDHEHSELERIRAEGEKVLKQTHK